MGSNATKNVPASPSENSGEFTPHSSSNVRSGDAANRTSGFAAAENDCVADDKSGKGGKMSLGEPGTPTDSWNQKLDDKYGADDLTSKQQSIHGGKISSQNERSLPPAILGGEWSRDNSLDDSPARIGAKTLPGIKSTPKSRIVSYDSDNEILNELTRNTDDVEEINVNKYPQGYAQKITNQQYKRQKSDLLREKTIVRDADEWAYAYEDKHSSAYHEKPCTPPKDEGKIGKTIGQATTDQQESRPADIPSEKRTVLPQYNVTEEMLMMEIEKQFL